MQHAPFIIKTDQKSLENLTDQRLTTPWQLKAYTKLLGLNYKIMYKKGTDNSATDALSRLPLAANHCSELFGLSVSQPVWVQQIVDSYSTHPPTLKLLQSLSVSAKQGHFVLDKGIIKYKNRI